MRMIRNALNHIIINPNKPLLLVAFILLGALFVTVARSQPQPHPLADPWGNVYPELCRTKVPLQPYEVKNMTFKLEPDRQGRPTIVRYGAYWKPGLMGPSHVIGVNALIRDKMTHDAIVLHERCHLIMWEQTGSADWHN